MTKKYKRNPDQNQELEEINGLTQRVGKLYDRGLKVPEIQASLAIESRSKIEHHKTVYRLFKRAGQIQPSDNVKSMLENSGLRFANCAGKLLELSEEDFVNVLEFIADPKIINISALKRDELTKYVKNVISNREFEKEPTNDTLHDTLKKGIARSFLHNRGIPTSIEVTLENKHKGTFPWDENKGLRIDVAGFDEHAIYGVEVKTSLEDFEQHIDTIRAYSDYLDYIYILTCDMSVKRRAMELLDNKFGVIYFDLGEQRVLLEHSREAEKNMDIVSQEKQNLIKYRIFKNELNKYIEDSLRVKNRHN